MTFMSLTRVYDFLHVLGGKKEALNPKMDIVLNMNNLY
jgi:hypothetical protein